MPFLRAVILKDLSQTENECSYELTDEANKKIKNIIKFLIIFIQIF